MKIEIKHGQIISPKSANSLSGFFELKKWERQRTNPQNRYIHGYLFIQASKIMTEKLKMKISPKMAKYILKARCAVDYVSKLDEWIQIDTRDMSTVRMDKFIDDCLIYMATKYNAYLLKPNEIDYNLIEDL